MAPKYLSVPLILIIRIYQIFISPLLPRSCRYFPTCSDFSIQVLKKYGCIKGGWLTLRRITRCHPGHPGGYDPVP